MDWKSEPNKRALAILRVSSHRQTDNFSHELQETEIHEYCKKHQLTLVEVRKITESAKNSEKRHQYNAALDWALGNGCLHVLFFVADRESRNLQDVEQNEKQFVRVKSVFTMSGTIVSSIKPVLMEIFFFVIYWQRPISSLSEL